MFDHGMYRYDNNKEQHFIHNIVHKKQHCRRGSISCANNRLFAKPNRTTHIYQL